MKATHLTVVLLVVCACAVGASAAVVIDTASVGNPGNAGELSGISAGGYGPDRVCGAVDYTYNIGMYEVTAGQYVTFLNAVAATDTYGLYNPRMWSDPYGDQGCKIQRSGTAGNYTYSVAADRANRPVDYVSYWDACRFTNWLQNGQPTGAQGPGTTETGTYTLDGYNGSDGRWIERNPNCTWAVTSEDEWYKAAYHKNDGVTGNYFNFPTGTDTVPSRNLVDPDPGNNATYWDRGYTIGEPYYRTEVGAHENSDSPYGTFDQGGNVWEWNEGLYYENGSSYRGLRGGGYSIEFMGLQASTRGVTAPSNESLDVGFRVSAVPEPATMVMLALAGVGIIRRR